MPFLTKADLTPPLYQEIIDAITRGDDTIVATAIKNGIAEMTIYLNRHDTLAMFGSNSVEPTYTDDYLKSLAKDIVAWQLLKMGNPSINLELYRTAYSDAIKVFKQVMKGEVDPKWPLKQNDPENLFDVSGHIASFSNTKRRNHY
jgi:hypothetical protein